MEVHHFNVKSLEQTCLEALKDHLCPEKCIGLCYRVLNTAEYYNPDTNQWTLITPMGTPRCGLGVIAYMGHIFAVGGSDGSRYLRSAEAYDPVTNTWYDVPEMVHRHIVAYMGHIFAVGGSDGFRDLRSAEAYDPVTNTWYNVPEMVHTHRYFDIASGINNTLFCRRLPNAVLLMFRLYSKIIKAFDYRTNSWITVHTHPSLWDSMTHLFFYSTVFLGRHLYIVGGGIRMTDPYNIMWSFNLVTHTWQEMSPMQESRRCVSVTVLKGNIYAMGGYRNDDGTSLRTAERYQSNINQWTFIASMNEERVNASCTTLNNKIYICGGRSLCVSIKVFKDIRRTNV
uniref:Kelch-like protein 10 n=1 Tax=Gouania willdenowi TaxID=441366 RepID=A0A8C5GQ60_GOUWI